MGKTEMERKTRRASESVKKTGSMHHFDHDSWERNNYLTIYVTMLQQQMSSINRNENKNQKISVKSLYIGLELVVVWSREVQQKDSNNLQTGKRIWSSHQL